MDCWTDGQTAGRMDGCIDWLDRWMDGRMDKWIEWID